MKAKELAEQLMKNPDFEVVFEFSETKNFIVSSWGCDLRRFETIDIGDIGYSSQTIILGGVE